MNASAPRRWRLLARHGWQARQAAAKVALARAVASAPAAPGTTAWQALCSRLRRAAARGDAEALDLARLDGLAAVIAAVERRQGPLPAAVHDAALALCRGAAVELAGASARRTATALAAASTALADEPVHVVCPGDEDAVETAQAMAPVFAACGLRCSVLTLDMPPAALAEAYHAPVVCAGVRRLAADLARDAQLTVRLGADGPVPRLVPPVRQAFIEPLDRVLADDALGPLVLSVADDPTRLGDALAAACRFVDTLTPGADHDGLRLQAAGLQRLTAALDTWPPAWRGEARSEALVRQALYVRDGLVAGRDYQRLGADGEGALWLDETLGERLPERGFAPTLQQALQLRLGLPMSPVARTMDRSSVPLFFAHYPRLAGCAPSLQGLDGELWAQYGLLRHTPEPLPHMRCRTLGLASETAATQALVDLTADPDPDLARLVVLRRAGDAAPLQARVTHPRAAWALASVGPEAALRALAAQASPTQPHRLRIVFAEPIDHRRGEQAWLLRAADAGPGGDAASPEAIRIVAADGRWVAQQLPLFAPLLKRLCRWVPPAATWLLPPLVALAQATSARRARAHRMAMPERERMLQRQLSFTAAAAPPAGRNP